MARGRPSKKAHVVDAACRLFTKQGYQSTSIDQVVQAAEVSKPTVYSNFPTKLALWETVIEQLIDRAEEEMSLVLGKLQSKANPKNSTTDNAKLVAGWIALWESWVEKQERLAVYRVLLGEQHKMADSTVALFDQFEAVLESILTTWLELFDVSPQALFRLKAISKEALLMPVLLNQRRLPSEELETQLEWMVRQ